MIVPKLVILLRGVSEPCQISKMERFVIFAERSIVDV